MVLCLAAAFAVPPVWGQVAVSSSIFLGSPYVWRGEVLSGGWVFQPTVSATYGGLSATVFGNVDPNSQYAHGKVQWNQVDLTVTYGGSVGALNLNAGYTLYTFPTPDGGALDLLPSQEVFGSVGLDFGAVQPSALVAYDFDRSADNPLRGLYAEGGLVLPVTLAGQVYNFAAALGLDAHYYQQYYLSVDPAVGDDETSLSHLALSVTTSLAAGAVSVSPLLGLQISLDDTYRRASGSRFFYGGLTLSF